MTELTQDIVRELLDYDPGTGVLTWKWREEKWFQNGATPSIRFRIWNSWNTKNAGKEAMGCLDDGYKQGLLFRKRYKAHRIIWFWMTGKWPEQIDHINGDPADNRWENLRDVPTIINARNTKKRTTNTSGFPGVAKLRGCKTFGLQITLLNGERYAENGFLSAEAAYERWKQIAQENGYHENHYKAGRSTYKKRSRNTNASTDCFAQLQ